MIKKIILLTIILLLTGCKEKVITTVDVKDNLSFEYNQKVYLKDLVTIKDGALKDLLIDTTEIGNKSFTFHYYDNNNDEQNFNLTYQVVDTTKPLIYASKSYTIQKNDEIDLLSKIMCGDNYDRKLKCEVVGTYDINKPSTYNLIFRATDSSNNITEKDVKLIVQTKVDNSYNSTPYYISDLIKEHKNDNTMIGIDVSSWQQEINWEEARASGVEFAMLRIGYGHNADNKMVLDKTFLYNLHEAKANEIKVGIYFFSYATTNKEAIEQVEWIANTLKDETIDLPIAFDWENWKNFNSYGINFVDINDVARTFMNTLKKKGYESMLYGSASYLKGLWQVKEEFPTWLAHYTDKTNYEYSYDIWQLSNSGKVPGISGYVDLDIMYKK